MISGCSVDVSPVKSVYESETYPTLPSPSASSDEAEDYISLTPIDQIGEVLRSAYNRGDFLDSKQRASLWCKILNEKSPISIDVSAVLLTQTNQRVIRYDCERTRGNISYFRNAEVRQAMEALLTVYCESHSVLYKQGMNEILAVFAFLKCSGSLQTWTQVYGMFTKFIDTYCSFMFVDEDFAYLQKVCVHYRTLLRYHAPSLCSKLDGHGIVPELYVTPWFITLFASKMPIEVASIFWDLYLSENDASMFVFVAVALCISHFADLKGADKTSLPEIMTKISMRNEQDVVSIWKKALLIRSITPGHLKAEILSCNSQVCTSLAGKIVPMYVTPADIAKEIRKSNKKMVIIDTRPSRLVDAHGSGEIPGAFQFDLEVMLKGLKTFPVCETYRRMAEVLGVKVDENGKIPKWPVDVHICIVGLSDADGIARKLVKKDYTNLFFLSLTRFCNIPRVSLLKGGYEALHSESVAFKNHVPTTCLFCRIKRMKICKPPQLVQAKGSLR